VILSKEMMQNIFLFPNYQSQGGIKAEERKQRMYQEHNVRKIRKLKAIKESRHL
jgi:hypothetical protein